LDKKKQGAAGKAEEVEVNASADLLMNRVNSIMSAVEDDDDDDEAFLEELAPKKKKKFLGLFG
jgi:hypothetical protein